MMDYEIKVQNMDEKQVHEELTRLMNMLLTMRPETAMHQQILGMYELVQLRQQELMQLANPPSSETIDLGTVDSSEYYPDYSRQELLDVTVTQYIQEPREHKPK